MHFFLSSDRRESQIGCVAVHKALVCGSAVGARHAVPLQLRHRRTVATFIEFVVDLPRICEKSGLKACLSNVSTHQRLFNMTIRNAGQKARTILESEGVVKRHHQVAAFILAGGVSSRMGREKGLLEIGGEPLMVRTARLIEPLVTEVTVVGTPERYAALGLRAIADRNLGGLEGKEAVRTPLAGIATALIATKAPWNLILACDLPYLTSEWLDWLLGRAVDSGAQIVMPRTSGGLEPLAAVYRMECAARIVAALERGVRKVTEAMTEFRMECLSEGEWRKHDPEGRVLRNMNAPSDYEEVRKWLETR